MIRRLTLACVGLALCAAGATQLFAAAPEITAADRAVAYVRTLQQSDGGFPDSGTNSNPGFTIDAAFGIASTGVDPLSLQTGGKSASDYLASQAAAFSTTAPAAAKLVLGLITLDADTTSFGGINPLSVMEANFNMTTGQYGSDMFGQSYYILAEVRLGRPVPAAAISYTETAQLADGSWGFCCGFGDTNATALVIRALIAAGLPASDAHVQAGLTYLKSSQQTDGSFPYTAPGGSDPNSTAFVIQAIIASGASVDAGGAWQTSGGGTPLSALLSFQAADGALKYFGTESALATYQALPGLMLAAYPEKPASEQAATLTAIAPPNSATPTVTPTATMTPNATASASATTASATATTVVRTSTPAATASGTAASLAATATSTRIRSVLGQSAAPVGPSTSRAVASLPATGSGGRTADVASAWLLLAGGTLALLGAAAIRRGAR